MFSASDFREKDDAATAERKRFAPTKLLTLNHNEKVFGKRRHTYTQLPVISKFSRNRGTILFILFFFRKGLADFREHFMSIARKSRILQQENEKEKT